MFVFREAAPLRIFALLLRCKLGLIFRAFVCVGEKKGYFSSEGDYSALERRLQEQGDKTVGLCLQFKLFKMLSTPEDGDLHHWRSLGTKLFKGVEFMWEDWVFIWPNQFIFSQKKSSIIYFWREFFQSCNVTNYGLPKGTKGFDQISDQTRKCSANGNRTLEDNSDGCQVILCSCAFKKHLFASICVCVRALVCVFLTSLVLGLSTELVFTHKYDVG